MESYGYEGRTLIPSKVAHTPDIWIAGHGGAPVFNEIGGGTRKAVIKALERVLAGKKPTAIGQRALDVARERIAGRSGGNAILSPRRRPHPRRIRRVASAGNAGARTPHPSAVD